MFKLRTGLLGIRKSNVNHFITNRNSTISRKCSSISWSRNYHNPTIQNKSIASNDNLVCPAISSALFNLTANRPILNQRFMSYDSRNETHIQIQEAITNCTKKVLVFMRGSPKNTSCQYSGIVISILDLYKADYETIDVTKVPGFEDGIKTYTDSPTLPHVFISGSFVGDSNCIIDMDKNGKLEYLLDESKSSSSDSSTNTIANIADNQTNTNVPEEEFVLSSLVRKELVPEVPLISLGILKRITKVKKPGSFTADFFVGKYDHDFLVYPDPLEDRTENQQLKNQAKMVKQLWPQIWDDQLQLSKFNFNQLFQMSVSEMMVIFEAIGSSMRNCYDADNMSTVNESNNLHLVTKSIISLITRNCLTYWPLNNSANYKMKEFLPKKDLVFGGYSSDENGKPLPPIGFCWTEIAPNLGSLPPQEWMTNGLHGGQNADDYLIKGCKNKVLLEEDTENYLVFFRDKLLTDQYNEQKPVDEPNPAADPFVGCCLMHKSELKIGSPYQDSAGFKYTDVEFDTLVNGSKVVFPPERRNPTAVNIKALGQCASSAVLIGLLKDTLSKVYVHLLTSKKGLLTCDIVERKLANVTGKIFALESMLYYIAGMYDGLESDLDAHIESAILKIMTNEYSNEILRDLQQIFGSEMFILSKLQDQVNIFDSFLDGNIHNRLYVATMGVIWFARSKNSQLNQLRLAPWYPGYYVKTSMQETAEQNDWLTLDADIYGNLHPSLKEAAVNLEYIIKRVKWATELVCQRYGAEVTGAQSHLHQLSQLSIDAFILTAMCARASKSYCNGSRNADIDIALTTTMSDDMAKKVKMYIDDLKTIPLTAFSNKSREINQLNLRYAGYYAESPLDPNI